MKAIEIDHLNYHYPDGTMALDDISIKINTNRKVALLGANGSGKTTLMMHLNGLLMAQSGSIHIMEQPVTSQTITEIRTKVGILFDNPDNQLFSTTVFDDIAFGPFNMKCSNEDIQERTMKAMEQVGITDLARRPPHNLSLGQKKKAAIAGLLAMDLEIFVMDEPFSGLDPESVKEFLQILENLHQQGCTLLLSTHDVDLAYDWADDIAVMDQGKLVAFGGAEVLENQKNCNKWRLCLPTMYDAFSNTSYRPKNAEEARQCLNSYHKEQI